MVSRNRGFSMLELGMVVSIVGVTAVIAIPRVSSSVQRTKLERAASLLAADISRVRENAKTYGLEQTITFSGTTYTITTVTASGQSDKTIDLTKQPVESRIQLDRTAGVNVVKFNAYGVPDNEFVVGINMNGVWRMVTVTGGSGEVEVCSTLPAKFAGDVRNATLGQNATAVAAAPAATETSNAQGGSGVTANVNVAGLNVNVKLSGKDTDK